MNFFKMQMSVKTYLTDISEPDFTVGVAVDVGFVIDDADYVTNDQGNHEVLVHSEPIAFQRSAIMQRDCFISRLFFP